MITNQCPLQCAHCGPRSGPWAKGSIDTDVLLAALDEARERACQVINFSGGEPFILGQKLVEMVKATTDRGLMARITTGAYWSPTAEAADKRLKPLAEAGLRQLFISCSDEHRAFVPMNNVIEASRAARKYQIDVYLVLGTSKTSKTSSPSIFEAFMEAGQPVPWIINSPIIPFGRAEENISAGELTLQPIANFSGPCPSLTENPTIRPDGQVTGCAVVFGQECDALSFGDVSRESLSDVLDRMDDSPLAKWIHNIGVVELKTLIESNSSLRFAERYVNICHLCGDILGNPEAVAVLNELGLSPATA
ncbi:MAG TPA: radical SAM protein [Pyrinomonadaceae bacterium]|nr:radical SAM protein [Pyrinomonadaceae bacterium]